MYIHVHVQPHPSHTQTIAELCERGLFSSDSFCSTCLTRRPLRSKHCTACQHCVARYTCHNSCLYNVHMYMYTITTCPSLPSVCAYVRVCMCVCVCVLLSQSYHCTEVCVCVYSLTTVPRCVCVCVYSLTAVPRCVCVFIVLPLYQGVCVCVYSLTTVPRCVCVVCFSRTTVRMYAW